MTPDDIAPADLPGPRSDWLLTGGLAVAAVGALLLGITACSTVERTVIAPPLIEGAEFAGNKACIDCHGNIVKSFAGSVHSRFDKADPIHAGISGCESCHGAASKHIAAGGGRGMFIVNPGTDPANCFQCHVEINAQFHLPNHHPVVEGQMNCVQCHDPHGRDIMKPAGSLAMARLNESCANCHREQTKPVLYEHEALREGCVTCHQPHGSVNAKLLVERDTNLCLKCHSQVQAMPGEIVIGKRVHTADIRAMTCWSAGCHTAIHGSNVHPRMLY